MMELTVSRREEGSRHLEIFVYTYCVHAYFFFELVKKKMKNENEK